MAVQNQPSGWVGWIYFASMMMLVLGGLQALSGLVALFKDDFFLAGQNGLVVFNFTAWGWINLILGIVLVTVGLEIGRGSTWARVVASFLVALNAIANLAFLPAYPVWSIIALIIDLFIIYALTVHGGELRE
jgi:hypothetical protein